MAENPAGAQAAPGRHTGSPVLAGAELRPILDEKLVGIRAAAAAIKVEKK